MKKIIHLFFEDGLQNKENLLRAVYGLAKSQQESGETVEVWTISAITQHSSLQQTFPVKSFASHWSRFTLNPDLVEEIKELLPFTLFHLHGGLVPEFYTIAKLLKAKAIGYVVTPHGVHGKRGNRKNDAIRQGYYNHLEHNLLHNATFIHCATEDEEDSIRQLGDFRHIQLIPQGQDVASFRLRSKTPDASQIPIFGFCGSILRHQRSLNLLLDAFLMYKCENNGKGKLWLIAEENTEEHLLWSASMCEIKEDLAFFGGEKKTRDKLHLISQLDAFYSPSDQDEANSHVLDAAAMGKAVVVSEQNMMNAYVSAYMAGICLPKNTPEEIAKSMTKVADLKKIGLLEKLGNSARQMMEDHFDWKIIGRRMLDAYAKNLELAA